MKHEWGGERKRGENAHKVKRLAQEGDPRRQSLSQALDPRDVAGKGHTGHCKPHGDLASAARQQHVGPQLQQDGDADNCRAVDTREKSMRNTSQTTATEKGERRVLSGRPAHLGWEPGRKKREGSGRIQILHDKNTNTHTQRERKRDKDRGNKKRRRVSPTILFRAAQSEKGNIAPRRPTILSWIIPPLTSQANKSSSKGCDHSKGYHGLDNPLNAETTSVFAVLGRAQHRSQQERHRGQLRTSTDFISVKHT